MVNFLIDNNKQRLMSWSLQKKRKKKKMGI